MLCNFIIPYFDNPRLRRCSVCGFEMQSDQPPERIKKYCKSGPKPDTVQAPTVPETFADKLKKVFSQSVSTSTTSRKKACGGCGRLTPQQRAALLNRKQNPQS